MIEFIEGEDWCRYNGILMTPDMMKEMFGFDDKPEFYDMGVYFPATGIFYTDASYGKAFVTLLKSWINTFTSYDRLRGDIQVIDIDDWVYEALEKVKVQPYHHLKLFKIKEYKIFEKVLMEFYEKEIT